MLVNNIDLTKKQRERYYNFRTIENVETKRNYSEYNLLTFDIETWGLVPNNLALGIIYNGVEYVEIYTKEELLSYIESIKTNTLIYAHNGFNYDYLLFFEEILSRRFKFEQRGEISFLRYTNKNGAEIIFRDSIYILPSSLKDLGKSFSDGTYKGITPTKFINPKEIGFNREEFEKNPKEYNLKHLDKLDIEYCKDDCLVLWKVLENENVKGLGFKNFNTIAKIANTKMLNEIGKIEIEDYFDSQFANLYSGGLTDVFNHIVDNGNKIGTYDVNSMYPHSMRGYFANTMKLNDYFYENKNEEYKENIFFKMLDKYPNGKSIIEIRLKENTPINIIKVLKRIPLIPIYKTSYINLFDGRTYKVEVMNMELSNLRNPLIREYIEINPISSIHSKEEDLYYPFKDFIERTYNERLANKKTKVAYAQILKLIMNSSYGYFAMQNAKSDYWYGNDEQIAYKVFTYVKENLDFISDIKSFNDFKNETYLEYGQGYVNDLGDFEYFEIGINEYVNYVKNLIGDYEDYQIKNLERIRLDGVETPYYIMYWEGAKVLQKNKTSFYIASEITSKSRAYLGKMALEVELSEMGKVCYCDTDSLHIEIINEEKLKDILKPYLDNNELGKLKCEGIFDVAYWFSKKHYYLFKEVDNKKILVKEALKGFGKSIPMDSIIYERDVISVSKMASKIKRVSFDTNNVAKGKNFLNFNVSRNLGGEFFEKANPLAIENPIYEQITKHKLYLRNLYKEMLEKGLYVPNGKVKGEEVEEIREEIKSIGITLINEENVKNRINEINEYLKENIILGVFDSTKAIKLLPMEEEKILVREILKLDDNNFRIKRRVNLSEEIKKSKRNTKLKAKREEEKSKSILKREEIKTKIFSANVEKLKDTLREVNPPIK